MALPKKYFKMFPGNLKKAWAKFKADKKGTTKGSAKKTARKTAKRKTVTIKKGSPIMARRKVKRAAAAMKTRIVRRTRTLKPLELIIRALVGAGGGMASSILVNKTPGLKSMNPLLKSAVQAGIGLGSLYFLPTKFEMIKYLGVGSLTAGVFGAAQKLTPFEVLAGSDPLTNEEISALLNAGYLQGPQEMISLSGPQRMERNQSLMGKPNLMGDSFQI